MRFRGLLIGLIWSASVLGTPLTWWENYLKRGGVLEFTFLQRNIFHGREKLYEGHYRYSDEGVKIVYHTSPPFLIIYENGDVSIGYKGQLKTFRENKLKNPVVKVLIHLDRLEEFFSVRCDGKVCVLFPKGDLKRFVKRVEIFFEDGFPERLIVIAGRENRVIVKIIKYGNNTGRQIPIGENSGELEGRN